MQQYNPLISILIPSFNHERYVEQTIRSIWSQPYQEVEIIIIDDCSEDGSVALLHRLQAESPCRMEVLVNENRSGPAATINRAISLSNGELLALFASDDYYTEDPFSRSVEMIQHDSSLRLVYGNGIRFNDDGVQGAVHGKEVNRLLSQSNAEILEYLYTHTSPLFMQTVLLKKELMMKIGCYDESLMADDWLINTRIFEELARSGGRCAYLDEPVFYYRTHNNNLHRNITRHIALKLEFIDKVTPAHLKGAAKSNITYGVALMALNDGRLGESINLFRQSRQGGSSMRKTARFVKKLIVSATIGAVTRRIKRLLQRL